MWWWQPIRLGTMYPTRFWSLRCRNAHGWRFSTGSTRSLAMNSADAFWRWTFLIIDSTRRRTASRLLWSLTGLLTRRPSSRSCPHMRAPTDRSEERRVGEVWRSWGCLKEGHKRKDKWYERRMKGREETD